MKKLIVVIMLLISSFSYYGVVDENGEKNTNLQNLVGVKNLMQNDVVENIVQENLKEDKVDEMDSIAVANTTETQKNFINESKSEQKIEQKVKIDENKESEVSTIKQEIKQSEVQKDEPKQEEVSQSKVEENSTAISTQQSEQPISNWCIDGGTQHIQGDGANEHGYYSSWDEAYQAFENDTKDWNACQFKIGECWCGKYYYWAIEN